MAHRQRISTVLRRAQLLHLEKRTEHAWRLHLQSLDQWVTGCLGLGVGQRPYWGTVCACLRLKQMRFFFGRRGWIIYIYMILYAPFHWLEEFRIV